MCFVKVCGEEPSKASFPNGTFFGEKDGKDFGAKFVEFREAWGS